MGVPAMREEYDRAKLLDEVWAEPLTRVAARYGLSDVGLKKLCRRLQLPTPTRGHWAKMQAGRGIPPKPCLKEFKGDPRHLLKPLQAARTHAEASERVIDDRLVAVIAYEQDPAHVIKVPERVTRWHQIIDATRSAFRDSYKDGRGLPAPSGKALNISVSAEQRARALRIANTLIMGLEKRGYALELGTNYYEVRMFGVRVALSIFESTKRSDYEPTKAERAAKARGDWTYWPRYQYVPTGRLEIRGGYGWLVKDGSGQKVEDQLNTLIIKVAKQALRIVSIREEHARAEERRQIERREALAKKAIQDAEKEKLEALKSDALRWHQAQTIRGYLSAFEQNVRSSGRELRDDQQEYLAWGRAKADWLDPLMAVSDPVLDQDIRIPY